MTCKDCIGYDFCSDYEKYSEAEVKAFSERGDVRHLCSYFKSKTDFVEVVRCAECKHLDIINEAPIYARCKKHGIVFELWQDDTREHYCSWGERRKDDVDE